MAKNRKSFASKKFIATLPYLMAPSDEEIDRMEIEFSLQEILSKVTYEESFFQWMMEIDFAIVDEKMDDEICTLMENRFSDRIRRHNSLTHEEEFLFGDCDPWSGTGNNPHWDDWDLDDIDFQRDDFPFYSFQDYLYWNDDGIDMLQSWREFEESFCPEQAIVREMSLRGLKHSVRQALIREYCVI